MDKPEAFEPEEFEQVARELETDDDPERFGKLVKHKPVAKGE